MGKRYLHEALRNASINPVLYYSVEDVARLIESLNAPIPTTGIAMRKNLRMFARRNIHDEFSKKSDDGKQYLGGAWLYPINHVHPNSLSELREMHRNASFQAAKKEEIMPVVPLLKYRSRKVALILSLLGATSLLIAAYKLDGFQKFIRQTPKEFSSSIQNRENLSIRNRYLLAENLLDQGDLVNARREANRIFEYANLLPEDAGDAFHLLAKVAHRQGYARDAISLLNLSDREYQSFPETTQGRRRNIRTYRATLYFSTREYEKGLSELFQLYRHEVESGETTYQAYIALMISDGLFWSGRYEDAFEWGSIALDHYKESGDITGVANAKMNKAWLLLILGRGEKGRILLDEAKASVESSGYDFLKPFVAIAEALYKKCGEEDFDLSKFRNNPQYRDYCEFVEQFSCGIVKRIVGNDPPPQGGNDPPPETISGGRIVLNNPPPQGGNDRPPGSGSGGRVVDNTPPPQQDPPPRQ